MTPVSLNSDGAGYNAPGSLRVPPRSWAADPRWPSCPGLSPLTDEFPLKFRQRTEYMEDQFASAGCRVHALPQALKSDFAGGEPIYLARHKAHLRSADRLAE